MKDMFKKVEIYNEIAEIMLTQKAKIIFGEKWYHEEFKNYDDFKKYVRHEYIKEVADKIGKTYQRVRQIERDALGSLKKMMNKQEEQKNLLI